MASPERVLIIGATSRIAQETGRLFARSGAELFLAGRDSEKLDAVAADLRVRGARRVATFQLDVDESARLPEMLDAAFQYLGVVDVAMIAHGTLPNQKQCETSVDEVLKEFHTNCLSVIALLTLLAGRFELQAHGSIAVITSVAGDRGRKSNYVYGAAKGAVTLYLQGFRSRMRQSGVHVLTIKPGLVDTPMTALLPKNPLYANPESVARSIHRAIHLRRDIAYVPWFWRWVMAVIRALPEPVFKRLPL